MVLEICTEININGSAETVWSILMDFESYSEWNPFIVSISGEAKEFTKISADLKANGSRIMSITPTVQEVIPNEKFSWLGRLFLPRIFDAKHVFEIYPTSKDQVRFVHREEFRGILTKLLLKFIGKNTQQGFESMNQALKQRVEASNYN